MEAALARRRSAALPPRILAKVLVCPADKISFAQFGILVDVAGELRRLIQFLLIHVELKVAVDFSKSRWRHGKTLLPRAQNSTRANDGIQNPAGFQVEDQIINFAQFLVVRA